MPDTPDARLLELFARNGSEEAFAALVQRHIGLVHSVALRHTANPQHAEDITQAVFIILARKAGTLGPGTVLPGWLYHTARLTAANWQRSETRRIHREQEAFMQSELTESPADSLWRELSPQLDRAMAGLSTVERNALVLRYFQNKGLAEVGQSLKLSENAAQKRIARALEKLRRFFSERGVDSTANSIAETISNHSIQAVPAALAKSVAAGALAKGATASASTITLTKGALKIMAWTKTKTIIAGTITALLVGGVTVPETIHVVRQALAPNIAGTWEGIMPLGGTGINNGQGTDTRVLVKLSKVWGHYVANIDEIDLGRTNVPVAKVVYNFPNIQLFVYPWRNIIYSGKLNARATGINFGGMALRRILKPSTAYAPLGESDFAPQTGATLQGYWKGGIILSSGHYPDGLGGQQLANRDNWHGEPMNKSDTLPLDLKIAETDDGTFHAVLDSPMQGANGQLASLTNSSGSVKLALNSHAGEFQGKLDITAQEIKGSWIQGGKSLPAFFQRADYQDEVDQKEAENFSYSTASELQGHWKGTWHLIFGTNNIPIPLTLDIGKLPDGTYQAALANLEQLGNDAPIPTSSFDYSPPDLHMEWKWAGGAYDGILQNGKIIGKWEEGGSEFSLVFERTKE